MTREKILQYDNVPVDAAAAYLGKTKPFVYMGLRVGRLPFGTAVEMPGGEWSYHISPGLLIAYKEGTLPVVQMNGGQIS